MSQAKELTDLRKDEEAYRNLNAQSSQVTLKRLDLAFQSFFRRVKLKANKAGFPRFKAFDRYSGWGSNHGDGWKLLSGEKGKHGFLRLSGIGHIKIRGKARHIGTPNTCEIQRKDGKWPLPHTGSIEKLEKTLTDHSSKDANTNPL